LKTAIGIVWLVFWLYWLASAYGVKQGTRRRGRIPFPGVSVVVLLIIFGFRRVGGAVHSPVLEVVGTVLLVSGLGLAVWARVHLGRNWGMPTTEKAEPELVTSGPYRFVRHPIYSGLLLALLGTALATSLIDLIMVVILGAYFYYAATVEERNLTASFPEQYPAYRTGTKMLIPFVL
jgi:protein-S-isoprenylcysteine O-methyltransferase Ste14